MLSNVPINALTTLLLLVFFCISFELYAMRNKGTSRLWLKAVTGVWLGGIAIALMIFNVQYGTVVFDFRTVMLCLCGLFFGPIPTAVAVTMAVGFISVQNAESMSIPALIAECTYTIAAGATGAMFHDSKREWDRKKSMAVIAIAIGITQAITALCIYMSSTDIGQATMKDYAMVILAILPTTSLVIGIMMSARITHYATECKLKLLEDKYYKLILCNDDIFWEIDPSGKITYVSDNVTQALGYQPKELVGHMPYFFIEDVPSIRLITEYGKNNEIPGNDYMRQQLVLKHKGGNNVYCDTRVMSIIDPAIRKTSGFVCVTRNVTNTHLHNELSRHNQKFIREQTSRLYDLQKEIAEYQKKLEIANEETEEARKMSTKTADKQMSAISNICSEMTPAVDDINKYVAILRDKSLSDASKDVAMEQLLHISEFLKTLTADTIDSDFLAKGMTKVSLTIGNIEDTVNEICDYHNSRNKYLLKKPIILQREIDLSPDEKIVKTDLQHLRRIINILITNAYVFTNAGQITVKCSLQSDTELLVSVADTGIGVPEAAYKNMFKPFSENELPQSFRKSLIRHSGLGLSICKSLVELMGGQIWFVSGVGKGTTISFSIPYIKAGAIASEANAQYNWQGHTALVATQNRFHSILVGETLSKTHIKYRTIHIDDHEEPQDSDYFKDYDIIITDQDATQSPCLQAIANKYQRSAIITIDDHTTATAICKQIDKHLTDQSWKQKTQENIQ